MPRHPRPTQFLPRIGLAKAGKLPCAACEYQAGRARSPLRRSPHRRWRHWSHRRPARAPGSPRPATARRTSRSPFHRWSALRRHPASRRRRPPLLARSRAMARPRPALRPTLVIRTTRPSRLATASSSSLASSRIASSILTDQLDAGDQSHDLFARCLCPAPRPDPPSPAQHCDSVCD